MQPTLERGEFAERIWFDKEWALDAADARVVSSHLVFVFVEVA